MVDLLMEWRPDLAAEGDGSGSSPLHYASSDGDCKVVEAILRTARPEAVYRKDDKDGLSALHVAARIGHRRVVKALLERRPDAAELRDNRGRTFVHTAAAEARSPVVSLAIERFKDSKLRGLLDAQDAHGNTPLHLAVAKGAYGVVDALLRKGKVRVDVLNNDGHTPLDLTANSKSYFTMVSLVVTLVAFKASPQPKRQDHLETWSIGGVKQGIEKSCDNLVVVAVLIATVAFAAGFNVPGGFTDGSGQANLRNNNRNPAFVCFVFFDTLAVVTSVAAAILLVYGKASCSSGSWRSFVASLHCMWASLISLMLAFDAALVAVGTSCGTGLRVVHLSVQVLILWITMCVAPATSWLTNLRFLWQLISRPKGRHVVQRQYPFAGAFIPNMLLFMLTNFMAFIGFLLISFLYSSSGALETGKN
ncbi:unnamed protein product [Urochloa humidicola]